MTKSSVGGIHTGTAPKPTKDGMPVAIGSGKTVKGREMLRKSGHPVGQMPGDLTTPNLPK